jgi:DUF2075 family protein
MRKLNQIQKEKIMKEYGRVGNIIIMNTEQYGNEKNVLKEDIEWAYEIMIEQAQ